MSFDFTWLDGGRLIRFGEEARGEAAGLLANRGFEGYALLTTERGARQAPELARGAAALLRVPSGSVPDAAAAIRGQVLRRPLVALGGGRVIDSAKAVAATDGLPCAAIPTTLSGAEVTPFHRLPTGVRQVSGMARPGLVVGIPSLMASQPVPALAASAMNALGHAVEALYVRYSNPVAELAALRAATLLAEGLETEAPRKEALALGGLLAGWAVGVTGFALHHVVCQTVVRMAGAPHAETNAVMLPHVVRFMQHRAPAALGRLAVALGATRERASQAADRVAALSARAGVRGLRELGVEESLLGRIAAEASGRPQIDLSPDPPGEEELLALLRSAL
ncbi:MAG TPA: iron-containing alcohol dehydrogenase [Thermoleophilaceae bacterium]|nr:iron-containing alcohol dehydrogenase [Thermoleophilaceae bacterium]